MHNKLIELLKEQAALGNFDLLERVIHGQSFRPLLMSLPEEVKILLYNDFVGEDVFTVCLKDSDYPEGQEADQELQFLDFMEAMAAFTVEVDCLNEGQKVQLIKSTILSGNPFVFHHSKKGKCAEWGFGGKLGYGWKYRSETNTVGCYPEDLTALSKEIIENLNEALASL
jgi:hypothetical protein